MPLISSPALVRLVEQVRAASADARALRIRGGGTKDFYGQSFDGEVLDTRACAGIVAFEPSELVVTALAGTPLAELEAALAEKRQMLAFEPPSFGGGATVGGMFAAGLSGPRRAAAGAVRDFVLGATLVDGEGRVKAFGGQVMKNVAGYDLARVLCGSLGILGLVAQVSLKVLPVPAKQATMSIAVGEAEALRLVNAWAGLPLPVSATAWQSDVLRVRFSGAAAAVDAARARFAREHGAADVDAGAADAGWAALREHLDPFFVGDEPLWRVSVPSTAAPLGLPGRQLVEWGGAQRWLKTAAPAASVREAAARAGGGATLFRGGDKSAGVFHPLAPAMLQLHQRIKRELDPASIFNPGRMYAGL
ncbi:MAG: glycolate oxidase subunit GlcE [Burkholderiaceae bacterium]